MAILPLKRSPLYRIAIAASIALAVGFAPAHSDVPVGTTPNQKSLLLEMQNAFTGIAGSAMPFVVNIKSEHAVTADDSTPDGTTPHDLPSLPPGTGGGGDQSPFPRRSEATGSGAIVSPDGYIITNDHVVEGSDTVTVTLNDGREFIGKVASDRSSDLAIVKIDPGSAKLPFATFADSDSVTPGQWAIAIGSPFDLRNTMTLGIISAIHRHQTIGDSAATARYYPDLIQTDAAINPGNSGGPLINIDGKVIGINVAIESPVEGNAGVGFAIPAKIAQIIMTELIEHGKVTRGYLGLAPSDLTPEKSVEFGVSSGAWVVQVDQDSPAGRAGIHAADVITEFDGKPIDSELSLRLAIASTAPGKTVPIKLLRDDKEVDVTVTIAAPPPPASTTTAPSTPSTPTHKIGISVKTLVAEDRDQLGLDPTVTGALVTTVLSNSPAENAGMVAHDVITRIGHTPIATADDAAKALASLLPGQTTTVIIIRSSHGGKIQEIALDLKLW